MILETRQLTLKMVDLMSKLRVQQSEEEATHAWDHDGKNVCAETLRHFQFLFNEPIKTFFWLEDGPEGLNPFATPFPEVAVAEVSQHHVLTIDKKDWAHVNSAVWFLEEEAKKLLQVKKKKERHLQQGRIEC